MWKFFIENMTLERDIREIDPTETVPPGPAAEVSGVGSTSQVALKREALLARNVFKLMAAGAEVSILGGSDEEAARKRVSSDFESFMHLSPKDKRRKYKELRRELGESGSRSVFLSILSTYSDVARDSSNGPMDDLVRLEVKTREKEFDQSPLPSKLLLIAKLRIETMNMLVEKFPMYLSLWEDVSKKNGKTEEDIREEIAKMQKQFDQASVRGKAGISRDLKGRIETADLTRFQAYLEIYTKLFNEQGIVGNDDHPLPKTWQSMFDNVDLKRKVQLLHALESKTYLLLSQGNI